MRMRRALKHLPRRTNVGRYPIIRHIAHWARPHPHLWSYKPPYTTRAIYMGSVVTLLPLAGVQILIAFLLCLCLRANLTIAAALQFISNPLTGAPIYVGTYQLGKWILGLCDMQPSGWASGAAAYLTVGGVVAGLMLGLTIDLAARFISAHHHKRHRQLALLASTQDA